MITHGCKGVITDLQKADFQVHREDLQVLGKFMKDHKSFFQSLRVAQVINTPGIAIPTLFSTNHPEMQTNSFSTIEAACKWILEA